MRRDRNQYIFASELTKRNRGHRLRNAVLILLPILMISGADDPCTGGEKGREDSLKRLKEAGFREIRVKTIDGMRHEILNETENQKVFRIILDFFNEIE